VAKGWYCPSSHHTQTFHSYGSDAITGKNKKSKVVLATPNRLATNKLTLPLVNDIIENSSRQ